MEKNKYTDKLFIALLMAVLFFGGACGDDNDAVSTAGVAFETTAVGISDGSTSTEVKISFSRALMVASEIEITISESGVVYGTDYSTVPAASSGVLKLTVPAGSGSASFTVNRLADFIAKGSNVSFSLSTIDGESNVEIAGNTSVTVSFETIDSPGSSFTANIGGATEPNQVYVDLSTNRQTVVARTSWDLGFYTGNEDKVILNYATYAMAIALDKTDLNDVSASDTVGLSGTLFMSAAGSHVFVDSPDRSLDSLAIADVSATDSENKVYILNRGNGPDAAASIAPGSVEVDGKPLGWKKIRILKDGDDYVIQHADIAATSFSETRVSKEAAKNFSYFSFEADGSVEVEPLKNQWDIVFTVSSNIIPFGPGVYAAYGFSDFVLSNRLGGVEVAAIELETDDNSQVLDGQITYDDFKMENVDNNLFSPDGNVIGSGWRSVFTQSTVQNIFYLVKDFDGNIYKVQFLGLMDDQGNRGNSSLKYELL